MSSRSGPDRRQFLQSLAGAAGLAAAAARPLAAVPLPDQVEIAPKSLIFLWMTAGVPHTDLWSIHTGTANQGPFQPIKTSADGIEISETMPKVAEQFKHLSIIHTLDSQLGEPALATAHMLTGQLPKGSGIKAPHLGSFVSMLVGNRHFPAPFVELGGTAARIGSGFLSPVHAPLSVQNPGTPPEYARPPSMGTPEETATRAARRRDLLTLLGDHSDLSDLGAAKARRSVMTRALDLSLRDCEHVFQFDATDRQSLEHYGNTGFGRGCLLARKLVEAGASVVQVDMGGWNMAGDRTSSVRQVATGVLDPAMAALVRELAERGLLQDTLLVWLAPFGRSPRPLANTRLEPWAQGWDVVLGGAGIKPAVQYGVMHAGGDRIKDHPVSVARLHATLYKALGVDTTSRTLTFRDNLGGAFRPASGEAAIAELLQ